ncbi:hypothetical protein C8A05DRAFT_19299 [Staphylotrichum tortipilum]|uniref:Uncharacterized protein n=1 Tax=Staphylotrichum tortipilum TaxID=2831512 RepID=A0AAN6MDG9_9PEZI|nr:hypothetical protein C8A05DRAFT_19299 [Staphylotrichum longicolle]
MLFALCILTLVPHVYATFRNRPDPSYNASSNLRPENITNLDYRFYQTVGSYYNGTMTFSLSFRSEDPADDDSDKVCSELINKTLSIERRAMVAILEPSPDDGNDNPILLVIYTWDESVNLTGSDIYHDYQHSELYSADPHGSASLGTYWHLSTSNKTTTTPTSYTISGTHSPTSFAADDFLRFNFSQRCLPPTGRSSIPSDLSNRYLFSGGLLQPGWDDADDARKWAGTFPTPAIEVVFGAGEATVEVTGLFDIGSSGSGSSSLVGGLSASFRGAVDGNRSDELVLGKRGPVWTHSLGFRGQPLAGDSKGVRGNGAGWEWVLVLVLVSVACADWPWSRIAP